MRRKYLLVVALATWAAVMLTGNAFGGEIYSCVDKQGKKKIQNSPCGNKEKTIDRQEFVESSQRATAGATPVAGSGAVPSAAPVGLHPSQAGYEGAKAAKLAQEQEIARYGKLGTQQAAIDRERAQQAYRCTRLDGTRFVSDKPCPTHANVTISGGGNQRGGGWVSTSGTLRAPVTQEIISKREACQEAQAQRQRFQGPHNALDARIASVCN